VQDIRIYIEGGGNNGPQTRQLRQGFEQFLTELRDAATKRGLQVKVIMCGERQSALKAYRLGCRKNASSVNLFLVDSEGPVSTTSPWDHLVKQRDGFLEPRISDDFCHLMVQLFEAWLVADPDCLERYYGQGFHPGALPKHPDVEAISKKDVLDSLKRATRGSQKGQYHKIKHCSALLKRLSADEVRKRAKHCERLFATIERLIAQAQNG
jgi:hypothetical protein